MTTGRINQVAAFPNAGTRRPPGRASARGRRRAGPLRAWSNERSLKYRRSGLGNGDRADPTPARPNGRAARKGRLLRVRFETESPAARRRSGGVAAPVDRPGRRLPPAVAQRQLAPGRVDRRGRSLGEQASCSGSRGTPGSALANCCVC